MREAAFVYLFTVAVDAVLHVVWLFRHGVRLAEMATWLIVTTGCIVAAKYLMMGSRTARRNCMYTSVLFALLCTVAVVLLLGKLAAPAFRAGVTPFFWFSVSILVLVGVSHAYAARKLVYRGPGAP